MKKLAYIILALIILFNLYLYYPETKILADPNDNIFQYSLVARTDWVWKNYGCPFSLACLPNLVDHNVTTWAEGYPLPFYYSHIPQIVIVSSYNLIVNPICSLFIDHCTLYIYYNWTKYLLLALLPLPIFLALRVVGFSPFVSALTAFFAAHFSTDGLYGIDPPSFLWRGYGLTSQLYALFFAPLGIAFTYRALRIDSKSEIRNPKHETNSNDKNTNVQNQVRLGQNSFGHLKIRIFPIVSNFDIRISNLFFAILFLTLTIAGHLGIGIITLLSTLPLVFFDLHKPNLIRRTIKLFVIIGTSILILSYWIIPTLILNNYHIISFWDPIWKFNSYGWFEVVRQFFSGELFDWGRAPIISAFVIFGIFVTLLSPTRFPFALSFIFMFLFYFGRTTWNGLIDLVPGMKDFHLHRFVVGVHLSSLFLIPAALESLLTYLKCITSRVSHIIVLLARASEQEAEGTKYSDKDTPGVLRSDSPGVEETGRRIVYLISLIVIAGFFVYLTAKKTVEYNTLNARWIHEAKEAYRYDEKNFQDLLSYLGSQPQARIYAGRPGNWGKQLRLGSSELYMLLGVQGLDMSQFLPETWSMMSENDQNFDERIAEDYDLLNIKTIVSDKNHDFTPAATLEKTFGPFNVFLVPTTGWFDVVTAPMFVKASKTNFLNLVYSWHRGFPRRWKMHPLISIDKNPTIPSDMQRVIQMTDEVSYQEASSHPGGGRTDSPGVGGSKKNIFSDFPFTFPQATVSGQIKNERVELQTYRADVEVPNTCASHCTIMFKMSYHPNWRAKVDGQSVEKFAVFPYYLAVRTSSGTHNVSFTYQPNTLKVILLITTPFLVIGWIYLYKRFFSHRF